jgi:DNA-directed RNA polymerase specialized sigma54-like protein
MKTINTRLQEMTNKLNSKELFESTGLGNEINFHIFDYDPEDEYIVRDYLDNYLLKKTKLNLKIFDIYEIIVDILKEKGFLEKTFEYEESKGTKYVNNVIAKTLGIVQIVI